MKVWILAECLAALTDTPTNTYTQQWTDELEHRAKENTKCIGGLGHSSMNVDRAMCVRKMEETMERE